MNINIPHIYRLIFLSCFPSGACAIDEHQCGSRDCIPLHNLCDNVPQCEDGSDEAKCSKVSFIQREGIHAYLVGIT